MAKRPSPEGLRPTDGARWFFRSWWLISAVAPASAIVLVACVEPQRLEVFAKHGLVQPLVAALLALTVILSMRLTWGRFSNQRRKGVNSASSAAIAVRLWMVCFSLLFATMLLSSLVSRLPDKLYTQGVNQPKTVETQIEVKPAGTPPAVTSVNVPQ